MNQIMDKKTCIVTTSWDDGYSQDIKLSNILENYGIKGTFYIPTINIEKTLSGDDILSISKYHEIGSHTNYHFNLRGISPILCAEELKTSKETIEKLTGEECISFSYPFGIYDENVKELVKKTGFKSARTIKSFYTNVLDPFEMHPTIHMANRGFKYCIKGSVKMELWGLEQLFNWNSLAKKSFDKVYRNGGIWHLWGHSWELDTENLWDKLEDVLKYISSRKNVIYLTNGELVEYLSKFSEQYKNGTPMNEI